MSINAVLLTIGDELLIGQTINTNAAWIGEQLSLMGVEVLQSVTLGDEDVPIREALGEAFARAELVICTGGLGPTHDDVTRTAVAEFYGVELQLHEEILASVRQRFAERGLAMPESNHTQALVPEGFEVLPNPVGTAPGLWHADRQNGRERLLAVLPGVPHEMEHLMREEVLPRLHDHGDLAVIKHRTLRTTGIGESNLQEAIGDLSGFLGSSLRLAYLPSTSGVRLRLTARGEDQEEVTRRLDRLDAHLRDQIGAYIYGTDDDTLEAAVGAMLTEQGLTLALAESCTGGHVLNRLTNVAGSSAYVLGGVVAYCNSVKVNLLGVAPETLARDGAVSEACAIQMARGARDRLDADVGLSTTGVAGPGGGTPDKPVGTVWLGYADADTERAVRLHFSKGRLVNKELFVTAALNLVRRQLLRRERTPA